MCASAKITHFSIKSLTVISSFRGGQDWNLSGFDGHGAASIMQLDSANCLFCL